MSKLIIMKGLPASGKSIKAKELMKTMGNTVRINKDLLRTMLHFDVFNGRNEGITKDAAIVLAETFLKLGQNVIIDDTNLNPNTMYSWQNMGHILGAKVEVVKMDTPIEECLVRDAQREKSVGNTVIKNMALQYGLVDKSPYVLCDIDGTIADITHRLKYGGGETKDWKMFFSLMSEDTVREEVRKKLHDFHTNGFTIIFVTARPEDYREETTRWLDNHGLSFAWTLIMRRSNDKRPDTEVKQQILDTYFPDKSQIHLVIDDRPSVIRMWRENGLTVDDVGKGVEF